MNPDEREDAMNRLAAITSDIDRLKWMASVASQDHRRDIESALYDARKEREDVLRKFPEFRGGGKMSDCQNCGEDTGEPHGCLGCGISGCDECLEHVELQLGDADWFCYDCLQAVRHEIKDAALLIATRRKLAAVEKERDELKAEIEAARQEAFRYGFVRDCDEDDPDEVAAADYLPSLVSWIASSESEARSDRDDVIHHLSVSASIFDKKTDRITRLAIEAWRQRDEARAERDEERDAANFLFR